MSAHNVREDGSWLSRIDRGLFKVEEWFALGGGLAILISMLISVANILGRKLLNMPVPGYTAIMEQLVPLMAFFGIAYCQRLGGHIRMDIVVGKLKGRSVWVAELVGVAFMAILSAALVYGSFDHAYRALTLGDTTDDLAIPTWPVKMAVPMMLSFLILRLLLHVWGYSRAIGTGEEEPVAVPLIENAAEQALNEAKTVSGLEKDNAP